jgi:phosphonate transport system substrate-binding protein
MRRLLVLVVSCLFAVACGVDDEPAAGAGRPAGGDQPVTRLRVGLIPNIAPDQQRARYAPFGEYLEQVLNVDVDLTVATNYAGTVTALEADQLDIAYLGGLTYVQARQRTDVVPLVTEVDRETGTTEYLSQLIVRADSGIDSLEDLAGRDVAFGDPGSTSGSLYPRLILDEAGYHCASLDRCDGLGRVLFTGGHDAAIQAVANGQVSAAGVEGRILRRLQAEGKAPADLRIIAERRVQGYPWVAQRALPASLRERIVEAFTTIDDPVLLDLLRAVRYERVTEADYAEIAKEATRLGFLQVQR